jgi:hypothetical protein
LSSSQISMQHVRSVSIACVSNKTLLVWYIEFRSGRQGASDLTLPRQDASRTQDLATEVEGTLRTLQVTLPSRISWNVHRVGSMCSALQGSDKRRRAGSDGGVSPVLQRFQQKPRELFAKSILRLLRQCDACLDAHGDCFKSLKPTLV